MGAAAHDVVVVGSGAGGGAVAWALARRDVRVLVLEAGPAFDPLTDYRLGADDWERQRFPRKPGSQGRHTFAPLQLLEARWRDLRSWNRHSGPMVAGDRRIAYGYHHVRGVGGSTLHFTGEAHRLHPQAMRMHSGYGVASDWPLDYDELERHYVMAEQVIGVAGPANDTRRPRSQPCPLPSHALSYASRRLAEGCRKLGLDWQPNTLAALSAPYDGRPACNYCANCGRGCPRTDKGSVDVTFLRKAAATGKLALLPGCEATRIEAADDDRVSAVVYRDAGGREHRQAAAAVVVACGAVETPRLLLLSAGRHAPNGLGNDAGLVGRHFMETLAWTSIGLHPEPLGSHRGLPADGICWDFNAPDAIRGVIGGCRFASGAAEADLVGPIGYATRVVGGFGKAHKRALRDSFGRVLAVGAIGESLPHRGSYVDLDPKAVDASGRPLARIHSFVADGELRRLAFMAGKAREILNAAGVDELVEEYGTYDAFSATHVFGTCRMGRDPKASVVDPHGRSHRWRNLFVADASVFPSSGGGESPSLTIEALALRTGERMVELAGRREL